MSEYSGHDRPYPTWLPYLIGGVIVAALLFYNTAQYL
jgi:hypothetical protein